MANIKINNRFFISDLHLGCDTMADLRGYRDAQDFWNNLHQSWNDTISDLNRVYILGDVVIERNWIHCLAELKGYKSIILGNHDIWPRDLELIPRVKTHHMVLVDNHKIVLTHFPVHGSFFRYKRSNWINFHGHLHEEVIDSPRYRNLSVEQTGLSPKPFQWCINK